LGLRSTTIKKATNKTTYLELEIDNDREGNKEDNDKAIRDHKVIA